MRIWAMGLINDAGHLQEKKKKPNKLIYRVL